MAVSTTADGWAQIFPTWPIPTHVSTTLGEIYREMETTRFAEVVSAVLLRAAWPGQLQPEPDLQAATLAQVGRWYITAEGLVCLDENYWIPPDRFDEEEAVAHVIAKSWLYDPSDFLLALAQAYDLLLLHMTPAMRTALLDRQLQYAITYRKLLFMPEMLRYHHIYLVNRMTDAERTAFGAYLADAGFVARH